MEKSRRTGVPCKVGLTHIALFLLPAHVLIKSSLFEVHSFPWRVLFSQIVGGICALLPADCSLNYYITELTSSRRSLIPIDISTITNPLILPTIHPIRLNLPHNRLIRIRPNNNPQRRILHHGQLIHCLSPLDRIAGLGAVSVAHGFLRVDVVVGWVALGGERHGAAGPVGAEAAGFDEGEVDVPFGFELVGEGFGEAFDGPFGGAVDGEHGDSGGRGQWVIDNGCVVGAERLTIFGLRWM